jgi:hypothetical protein
VVLVRSGVFIELAVSATLCIEGTIFAEFPFR